MTHSTTEGAALLEYVDTCTNHSTFEKPDYVSLKVTSLNGLKKYILFSVLNSIQTYWIPGA